MNILKKIFYRIITDNKAQSEKSFFTQDVFKGSKYDIGAYTYGKPTILFNNDDAQLKIGKYCSIASHVTIFLGGNHRIDWMSTYPFNILNSDFPDAIEVKGHPATKGDVIIGNDVWIGRNATIMSGVTIGDGAVIGANSVVSKNIGDYEIWAGNPSRFVRKRFDDQIIIDLKKIKWWDLDAKDINAVVPYLCSDNIDILKQKIENLIDE